MLSLPTVAAAEEPPTTASALYRWLLHNRDPATGLVQSFETIDPALRHQAATYDQALAGMAFLLMNDTASARRILEFFQHHWQDTGFANFYTTHTGEVGIETTIHVGPNAWIGLLAMAYETKTADTRFWKLAESIALWIAHLPHREGGVAMGPRADWAADWPRVYSSENNLSYLALLDALLARHARDASHARLFEAERARIFSFLQRVTFRDLAQCQVNSGLNERGVDMTQGFDVVPLAIMVVKPPRLRELGVDPVRVAECSEQRFETQDRSMHGFDFTDETGARAAKRPRMISVEWTAMMIQAYLMLARDGESSATRRMSQQAELLQQELDRLLLRPSANDACYPYATRSRTQVFPYAPWWKTPAPGPMGLACSVAGTTWRYFASRGNLFEWN